MQEEERLPDDSAKAGGRPNGVGVAKGTLVPGLGLFAAVGPPKATDDAEADAAGFLLPAPPLPLPAPAPFGFDS